MIPGTSFFPGGAAGVGLLFLRLSVATSALLLATLSQGSHIPQVLWVIAATGLFVGLQTRLLAALGLLGSLLDLGPGAASLGSALPYTLAATALVMTGAGAFSADARLFGRRTISLPERDDPNV